MADTEEGEGAGEGKNPRPQAGRCRIGWDGFYGSGCDWGYPRSRGVTRRHRARREAIKKAPATQSEPAPLVDPERIGALLDGRLNGEEREAALLELAASEDDGTVFHDTAAVLREAEEEEGR